MNRQVWLNIPNMITLGRIFAVPVMIWFILEHDLKYAFWLFILAGVSDGLDGYLAKIMKAQSTIGAYLDPIADKFLLVSAFVILGVQDLLPLWLVIMVVFRDFAIVIGAALIELLTHNLRMSPNFSSKINTTVQIILIACVLGIQGLAVNGMGIVVDGLILITGITTAVSGLIYLYQWGLMISQANGD